MANTLLEQAAVIRDEQSDGKNTAYRVGALLVSIIEKLDQALTSESITAERNERVSADDALRTSISAETSARTTAINSILTTLGSVSTAVNSASSTATSALNKANAAIPSSQKGAANGVVPLDESGKIASSFLPSYMDDVLEFTRIEEGTELEGNVNLDNNVQGSYYSSDSGCEVFYWAYAGRFMLRSVVIIRGEENVNYYDTWLDSDKYQSPITIGDFLFQVPQSGKVFLCKDNNKSYRWSGSTLAVIGGDLALGETPSTAFPGNRGVALENLVSLILESISDVPHLVDGLLPLAQQEREIKLVNAKDLDTIKSSGIYIVSDSAKSSLLLVADDELDGVRVIQLMLTSDGGTDEVYLKYRMFTDSAWGEWVQTGGAASVGNIYNVTTMKPINGYYKFVDTENQACSAVHVAFNEKKAVLGLILSFRVGARKWKTYQYIGTSLELDAWIDESNWLDFGSLPAGSENYVIIDNLCGSPTVDDYYTLSSAISALVAYQNANSVSYAKRGLVISYLVGENVMETKQFHGNIADFSQTGLWKDFGGGSKVELSDTPAAGGSQAFSTGGAHTHIPVSLVIDTETTGVVKIALANADGEVVGDEKQFAVGTGGGNGAATIVNVAFKDSPLYGAYGSSLTTAAAIRSTTTVGTEISENSIERIEIVDRDSGLTVFQQTVNQQSSGDLASDFSFPIDFTPYFTAAGVKRYKLVAYDDAGFSGSKNITVTAVDVTCECVQVLQYSPDSPVTPDTDIVSIPMYRFGNNQSDKGILARIHIKIDGEWVLLQEAVVTDSFSHSVSVRPKTLGLKHGGYPVKIQGEDVASGTLGNTIYTAIMVVEEGNMTPIVTLRYDDQDNGNVRMYDTVSLEIAAYTPGQAQSYVALMANGKQISQLNALATTSYRFSQQIKGYATGDSIVYRAETKSVVSDEVHLTVNGSAIDAEQTPGTIYDFDLTSRSNDEADHTIESNGYKIVLEGANYTTNGFGQFNGKSCLRIAEKVKGRLVGHLPFASSSLEATGGAIQFHWAAKNIKDKKAKLIDCYNPETGAGFYVTGAKVGIYCKNGVRPLEERSYEVGTEHTAAIVVEPTSIFVERGGIRYSMLCLYLDGERVANIGYVGGSGNLFSDKDITFDGTDGDLYLFNFCAWNTYFEWAQAHKNYLVRLTDTAFMVQEFDFNNVLKSQTAEGTTTMRPSAAELFARGIPYCVEVATEDSFNTFDGGTNTSENFTIDLYYYDPKRPWRSFIARKVRKRRQGATSAKRPKKNPRYYLDKATEIIPIYPDYTNEDALLTYALFAKKKVRVGDSTIPVDMITIKIEFSDSSCVNDSGTCDMMNYTYRALGTSYLTPAQRHFDGTWTSGDIHIEGLEMNHSTANHPIAVYRSTSDTLQNVYFEARGNWKEDKNEQTALGFMNTPGYNLG
ncbi:MAG: hypothetical protein IKJ09_03265, partial [Bacteroidaceae bacterium]|nr:hypothetical protein [Bacteroidaceae bacterium]